MKGVNPTSLVIGRSNSRNVMSALTTSYAYHPITEYHDDACFVCFSLEGRRHTGRKPLIRKRFVRLTPLGTGSRLYMNRKRIRFLVHPSGGITTVFFILFLIHT